MPRFLHLTFLLKLALLLVIVVAGPAGAAVFTVDTLTDAADVAPGDGMCADALGACSLRAAIMEINARENFVADFDDIEFSVRGGIPLQSPLPVLTGRFGAIDGTTAPLYNTDATDILTAAPRVVLDGSFTSGTGLEVDTVVPVTISALSLVNFSGSGIFVRSGSAAAIQRCWIGIDALGQVAGNANGITLNGMALVGAIETDSPTAADGNLISGNTGDGIRLRTGSAGSVIAGNFIGTDSRGTTARPNGGSGISGNANDLRIGFAGFGNLISGNAQEGITLISTNSTIQENIVGLPASGIGTLPNGRSGAVLIGTELDITGNFLSGNLADGLSITGGRATITGNQFSFNLADGLDESGAGDNVVLDNLMRDNGGFGLDLQSSGSRAFSNTILANDDANLHVGGNDNLLTNNRIGPVDSGQVEDGAGVLISGNGNQFGSFGDPGPNGGAGANIISGHQGTELMITGDDNSLENNRIGSGSRLSTNLNDPGIGVLIDGAASTDFANFALYGHEDTGILITGATATTVRNGGVVGTTAGTGIGVRVTGGSALTVVEENTIRDVSAGVVVDADVSGPQAIRRTTFVNISGEPIDLLDDGRTQNDENDLDDGPNRLQNFAVAGNPSVNEALGQALFDIVVPSTAASSAFPLSIDAFEPLEGAANRPEDLGNFVLTLVYLNPGEVQSYGVTPREISSLRFVVTDAAGNTSEASDPLVLRPPVDAFFADGFEVSDH